MNGARYLDIRATWYVDANKNEGMWYTEHGILFVPVKKVLDDIHKFMMQPKSSKEVLIINLQNLTSCGKQIKNEPKTPPEYAFKQLEILFQNLKKDVGFLMDKKKNGLLDLPTIGEMIDNKQRILLYKILGSKVNNTNVLPSIANEGRDVMDEKFGWPDKNTNEAVLEYNQKKMIPHVKTLINKEYPLLKSKLGMMGFQISPQPIDYICGYAHSYASIVNAAKKINAVPNNVVAEIKKCEESKSYQNSLYDYATNLNQNHFWNFMQEDIIPLAPERRPNVIRVDAMKHCDFGSLIEALYLQKEKSSSNTFFSYRKL